MSGVRFVTEVHYRVKGPHGLTYRKLPALESASARTCALTSVIQCMAILGQLPQAALKTFRRIAGKPLPGSLDDVDEEGILRWVASFDTGRADGAPIAAQWHASASAGELGALAQHALLGGQTCLLCFETATSRRWATVIGVELNRLNGKTMAMLLLDASTAQPWSCGHNVRIELGTVAGRPVRGGAGLTLNCRHLTGEACMVRLRGLIVLRPAPVQA